MNKKQKAQHEQAYVDIFASFGANVVGLDCGKKCAPHNGGIPVCCDTGHAIPIISKNEWTVLSQRSDMWHKFKAVTPDAKQVLSDLSSACMAVECKGARLCERDNRSMACRAFPFFPYIDKNDNIIGLSYYWNFADRCWVISNMGKVRREFVQQFLKSYDTLFAADPEERQVFRDHSATMRRVFSRKGEPIYVIQPDMTYLMIKPKGAGTKLVQASDLPSFPPYYR